MFTGIDPIDFGFVLFCIFVGSGVFFVLDKDTEGLGVARRVYIHFASLFMIGLAALIAITKLHWDYEWVSLLGLVLGIGGYQLIRLISKAYTESNSLLEFIQLCAKMFTAAWKVWSSAKLGTPPTIEEEEPPTTKE